MHEMSRMDARKLGEETMQSGQKTNTFYNGIFHENEKSKFLREFIFPVNFCPVGGL